MKKLYGRFKRMSLIDSTDMDDSDSDEDFIYAAPKRKKRKINPPQNKWLKDEIDNLDMICMVDEYMTRLEEISETDAFDREETCGLPYVRQELFTWKYRSTMWNYSVNEHNLDPVDTYFPLSKKIHRKKIQIPLGWWEVPNASVNGEWNILSRYEPSDGAIKGYIKSVALQASMNKHVRNMFYNKLLEPWNLRQQPSPLPQKKLHDLFVPCTYVAPTHKRVPKRKKMSISPPRFTPIQRNVRRRRRRSLTPVDAFSLLNCNYGVRKKRKRQKLHPKRRRGGKTLETPKKPRFKQTVFKLRFG